MDPYLGDCVPDAVHQGDVNKHLSAKYSLLFFIHFCTVALHTHTEHTEKPLLSHLMPLILTINRVQDYWIDNQDGDANDAKNKADNNKVSGLGRHLGCCQVVTFSHKSVAL